MHISADVGPKVQILNRPIFNQSLSLLGFDKGRGVKDQGCRDMRGGVKDIDVLSDILFEWPLYETL